MVLRRRVSRRELPQLPEFAAALTARDMQWSPEEEGKRLRYTPVGTELAVRVQGQTPMVFPAAPERLYLALIEGAPYLCCTEPYLT